MAGNLAFRIDWGSTPGTDQNANDYNPLRSEEPHGGTRRRPLDPAALAGWMEGVARGEEPALAALYDATVSRVYGLALRITRNVLCAEDVVSETYLKAWKQASDYNPARGSVLSWLLVIARSRAIDALRNRDPAQPHPDPAEGDRGPASAGDDPQDLLQATRTNSALHAAVAALEPRARQLIALAFFRGLAHSEIAQHTGLPLGTVKTLVRRGLASLRDALPADLASEP